MDNMEGVFLGCSLPAPLKSGNIIRYSGQRLRQVTQIEEYHIRMDKFFEKFHLDTSMLHQVRGDRRHQLDGGIYYNTSAWITNMGRTEIMYSSGARAHWLSLRQLLRHVTVR